MRGPPFQQLRSRPLAAGASHLSALACGEMASQCFHCDCLASDVEPSLTALAPNVPSHCQELRSEGVDFSVSPVALPEAPRISPSQASVQLVGSRPLLPPSSFK
eukprot:7264053-Pyramimonas_sp.AAC.1